MKFRIERHGFLDWRLYNGGLVWFCDTKFGAIRQAKKIKRDAEKYKVAKQNAWEFEL